MSAKSLKILLTADPFLPVPPVLYGGIERIVHGIAQELRHRGHRVGLVAHPESSSPVDFFRPWPGLNRRGNKAILCHSITLRQAVSAFEPDVVHSFSRLLLLLPLMMKRRAMIMSYQRDTGGWRNRVAAMMGRDAFAFTGCSEYIASKGRTSGGRWLAIHNFADVAAFRFAGTVAADAPLVFLSRLEAIKGAHAAIRIAVGSGRRLVLAGNRVDSPEGKEYWSRRIEPFLGRDGIEYIGPVDDRQKDDLLGKAAALVVPIEWDEPFGIVFAEALACGTPVISCPRGALPEIVRSGQNGFLVNTVDEGIAAVARLPEIDRHTCRRDAEERFSPHAAGDAYMALYQDLIAKAGR